MDAIAVQLQGLSDDHVTLQWRLLHEAAKGWFLWRLMHDRLANVHHLHNLIWVDNSGGNPDWHPGDDVVDVVDVVGVDAYPSGITDPLSSTWETLETRYGSRKLPALMEFGGVPDIAKMQRYGIRPAYFVSWTGDAGPKKNGKGALARIYQADAV